MTKYIGNSFSLQMLKSFNASINVEEVASIPSDCVSVVGHADTAAVLGVAMNRVSLKLEQGDILYVAQLTGGRLPEGTTTLPEGFSFVFLKVVVNYN